MTGIIQDDLKKMNYFATMQTDLANLYRDGKIDAKTCADWFVSLLTEVYGYQQLDHASEALGRLLQKHGEEVNFWVESIHGKDKAKEHMCKDGSKHMFLNANIKKSKCSKCGVSLQEMPPRCDANNCSCSGEFESLEDLVDHADSVHGGVLIIK